MMGVHMLTARLVRAGIDPASVVVRVNGSFRPLAVASHPGLRPITRAQVDVLRKNGIPTRERGAVVGADIDKVVPLAKGRYWIDVVGADKVGKFAGLLNTGVILGAVKIESVELSGTEVSLDRVLEVLAGAGDPQAWFLFEVLKDNALAIDESTFGRPTVADSSVHHRGDTAQKPAAPEAGLPTWAILALGLGAVFVASQAFANFSGGHRS